MKPAGGERVREREVPGQGFGQGGTVRAQDGDGMGTEKRIAGLDYRKGLNRASVGQNRLTQEYDRARIVQDGPRLR